MQMQDMSDELQAARNEIDRLNALLAGTSSRDDLDAALEVSQTQTKAQTQTHTMSCSNMALVLQCIYLGMHLS
jgi:hypothetical protein